MRLFKYLVPQRIDILKNQYIRFSQPYALNDPFESLPFYNDHVDVHPLVQLGKFGNIIRHYQDTGELLENEIEAYETERKRPKKSMISWYINSNFVSLSLTTKNDDLLMWSHYASNHQGFVLELDGGHPFFTQQSRHLYKVPYSNLRPQISLADCEKLVMKTAYGLKNEIARNPAEMEQLIQLFRKSEHWSYEQEWRLLAVPQHSLNPDEHKDRHTLHLSGNTPSGMAFTSDYLAFFEMPPSCIKAIYCGVRMPKNYVLELFFLISNNPCYAHIDLQRASLDNEFYQINFNKIGAYDVLMLGELQYEEDIRSGKRKRIIPNWYNVSYPA